jgi:hypothetical protein
VQWEQRDLAIASKASLRSIKRLESAPGPLDTSGRTVDAIRRAFEDRGVNNSATEIIPA